MAQIAGSPIQQCGQSEPAPVTEGPSDNSHWLQFRFRATASDPNDDSSGYAIEDSKGFRLTHPSGAVENGVLSQGELYRSGVPEGCYELTFCCFTGCAWSGSVYSGEPTLTMTVDIEGFPDGTDVNFQVFERFQSPQAEPLFETTEVAFGGKATTQWKYEQKLGEPPGGQFVFQAQINEKRVVSDPVTIRRYPLSEARGIQQRLKELGYDCGPTDGVLGSKTKAAVKAFQEDHPPLAADGIPGPLTQSELAE
jgi:hypothetical protein